MGFRHTHANTLTQTHLTVYVLMHTVYKLISLSLTNTHTHTHTHHAPGTLATLLQAGQVPPGAVGLESSYQGLKGASAVQILSLTQCLVHHPRSIPDKDTHTRTFS